MEEIKVHIGKTVALMNDNIDTDQIIPKSFLNALSEQALANFSLIVGATCRTVNQTQTSRSMLQIVRKRLF